MKLLFASSLLKGGGGGQERKKRKEKALKKKALVYSEGKKIAQYLVPLKRRLFSVFWVFSLRTLTVDVSFPTLFFYSTHLPIVLMSPLQPDPCQDEIDFCNEMHALCDILVLDCVEKICNEGLQTCEYIATTTFFNCRKAGQKDLADFVKRNCQHGVCV